MNLEMSTENICELCGSTEKLTKHHLVPKVKYHKNYSSRKNSEDNFIWICDLCHRTIHAYFSENFLRDNLNTLEKLKENDQMKKYIEWRRKHLDFKSNSTKLRRNF